MLNMRRLSKLFSLDICSITGIVLGFFFIWTFSEITESILSGDTFVAFDQWVVRHMLHLRTPYVTSFMETITHLGGTIVITPCSVLIAIYFLLIKQNDTATCITAAVLGGIILNNILKILYQRPRPISESTLIAASGWGYPSGHAMNSIIFYGMMVYLISTCSLSRGLKIGVIITATSVVFIVGISRIYLQVHYASDVMAGFAVGLFWLCVCITGMEINRKRIAVNNPKH